MFYVQRKIKQSGSSKLTVIRLITGNMSELHNRLEVSLSLSRLETDKVMRETIKVIYVSMFCMNYQISSI